MSVTLTHTRPALAPSSTPHQTSELEPVGLADFSQAPATTEALGILDAPETEAILVIQGIVTECRRPVLPFSGGKDSVVMLYLARRVFQFAPIPFPVLHVDIGHNSPELLTCRDRTVEELGLRLVVARVQNYTDDDRLHERTDGTRSPLQTIPLLDATEEGGFSGVFGGGRHDEEKARAKEYIVSLRDGFGQWDPYNQRPELWNLLSPRHRPGEHVRAFPLNSWTELDVWRCTKCKDIVLPGLYYAHERKIFPRDRMWLAAGGVNRLRDGKQVVTRTVRCHTMGGMSYTGATKSTAATNHGVVLEVAASILIEREATHTDDRLSEATMGDRKKEDYFR